MNHSNGLSDNSVMKSERRADAVLFSVTAEELFQMVLAKRGGREEAEEEEFDVKS